MFDIRRKLLIVGLILSATLTAGAQESAIVYLGEGQEELKPIMQGEIERLLPGIKVQFIGYQEPAAKLVIQQYNLRLLPFVFLSQGVINAPNFMPLVRDGTIDKLGNLFYIPLMKLSSFGFHILGNQKLPHQLDIYTMSFDPNSQQLLRQLIDLIRNKKADVSLRIRFITVFRPYGIDSPLGPEQIKENIHQLIIQKNYPDKFFDYVLMREGKSFADVLSAIGLEAPAIEAKEEEGLAMLKEDAELARTYGINASPTFLWENQFLYFAWERFSPVLLKALEEQEEPKTEKAETKPKKKP